MGRSGNQHDTSHRLIMHRSQIQNLMESRIRIGTHRQRWVWKRGLAKASITVSQFFHFAKRISPLVCFKISPCEIVCVLCTISQYSLHLFTIMRWRYSLLHHFTTVFHHFTVWTCVYSLHHCTILFSPQHYTKAKAYFVTPLHHYTISNYFAYYSTT